MITLTKTGGSIEINFSDTEKHYMSSGAFVFGDEFSEFVMVYDEMNGAKIGTKSYKLLVEQIVGRPSDDSLAVAEWMRDTYFSGVESGGGGGGGGDASAANQVTEIARLDSIVLDVDDLSKKTASGKVTVPYDEKVIVYSDAANGVIDYIRYNLSSSEVARDTWSYDGFGNLTGIS